MTASRELPKPSLHFRIQAMLWLIFMLLVIVATILLWMYSQSPTNKVTDTYSVIPNSNTVTSIIETKPDIIAFTSVRDLGEYVTPIQLKTVIRDFSDNPKEFKDQKFFIDNKFKWTIQVMTVEKYQVITDYLSNRVDRKDFSYFRHTDSSDTTQYTLLYSISDNYDEAVKLLQETKFNLPAGLNVTVELIGDYKDIIDNYVIEEEVFEFSANRAREVVLKPTRRELPVRKPKPEPKHIATNNKIPKFESSEYLNQKNTDLGTQKNTSNNANTQFTASMSVDNGVIVNGVAEKASHTNKPTNNVSPKASNVPKEETSLFVTKSDDVKTNNPPVNANTQKVEDKPKSIQTAQSVNVKEQVEPIIAKERVPEPFVPKFQKNNVPVNNTVE